MIPDKTYCINLDRRPDRWQLCQQQFQQHGLTVERFAAIDARDFKINYPCDNGNNGCTLSHYFLIERAKLLGMESVMIFEDDCYLHSDFNALLPKCMAELPANWDMLYFGGSHREKPIYHSHYLRRVQKTLTTHGYILRNAMFDLVIDNFKKLQDPVDCFYAAWQKERNVFVTNPPIAWQARSFSDIVGREMHYPWIRTNDQ